MECRICGRVMRLDDRDSCSNFNVDKYWVCSNCSTSCIEEIRGGRPFKEYWHTENDRVRNFTVNYKK